MDSIDLQQMISMVKLIAEEKGLPEETVLTVIEQALAAAWRKESGEREMNIRATLNTNTGEADVYIARQVVEDGVGYNPNTEIPLEEARKYAEEHEGSVVRATRLQNAPAEEGAEDVEDAENTETEAKNADGETENTEPTAQVAAVEITPDTDLDTDEAAIQIGGIIEEKIPVKSFGRVAAMTAKQVTIQRLREAENDAVLAAFEDKVGTVVTGTVARVEPKLVRIDLDRASGIMPRSEQIEGEYYTVGHRIKVYIKNIERGDHGTQLILSRGNAQFIEYLFRQEVPELANGTVKIRGIAREAGRRTKISVESTNPGIDPVGTFVGGRGIRVQAVMNEIGDREKIDIINWSDNASEYIREALSPAEITKVDIDGIKATVYVTEDQQKIAIGTKGQNVRLASKLTGFDIDIQLAKTTKKRKKHNIEDDLLSAVEDSGDVAENAENEASEPENAAEVATDALEAAEASDVAEAEAEATAKAEVTEVATEATEAVEAEEAKEAEASTEEPAAEASETEDKSDSEEEKSADA